jgi:hypothetical protein
VGRESQHALLGAEKRGKQGALRGVAGAAIVQESGRTAAVLDLHDLVAAHVTALDQAKRVVDAKRRQHTNVTLREHGGVHGLRGSLEGRGLESLGGLEECKGNDSSGLHESAGDRRDTPKTNGQTYGARGRASARQHQAPFLFAMLGEVQAEAPIALFKGLRTTPPQPPGKLFSFLFFELFPRSFFTLARKVTPLAHVNKAVARSRLRRVECGQGVAASAGDTL